MGLVLATPSNAILGFSKCERIKKQLNQEEQIGYENWKMFDQARDQNVNSNNLTFNQLTGFFDQLKLVYQSDLSIYKTINTNSKCFDPKFNAENRARIQNTQKELKDLNSAINIINKLTTFQKNQIITSALNDYLRNTYKDFYNWQTNKILRN